MSPWAARIFSPGRSVARTAGVIPPTVSACTTAPQATLLPSTASANELPQYPHFAKPFWMSFVSIFAPQLLQLIASRLARLIVTSVRFLMNSSGIGIRVLLVVGLLRVHGLERDLPRPRQFEHLERLELAEEAAAERLVEGGGADAAALVEEAAEVRRDLLALVQPHRNDIPVRMEGDLPRPAQPVHPETDHPSRPMGALHVDHVVGDPRVGAEERALGDVDLLASHQVDEPDLPDSVPGEGDRARTGKFGQEERQAPEGRPFERL